MVMGISKMLRTTLYLLPLLFLYQVIYANTGARWIASDLSVITDAADSGDAYAQVFWHFAICMETRDYQFLIWKRVFMRKIPRVVVTGWAILF